MHAILYSEPCFAEVRSLSLNMGRDRFDSCAPLVKEAANTYFRALLEMDVLFTGFTPCESIDR